jgi:hypothetical protein
MTSKSKPWFYVGKLQMVYDKSREALKTCNLACLETVTLSLYRNKLHAFKSLNKLFCTDTLQPACKIFKEYNVTWDGDQVKLKMVSVMSCTIGNGAM